PLRILSKPSQEAIMAIYHFDASVISRSKGRSATAAAAYRTAEVINDHRTGEVHDYTRKGGVLHTEIIAPDHAPAWAHDRSALWNAVEDAERRKDAQVAREVRVALPSELTTEQNADLVRAFVQEQFVARGMIADVALHAPGREGDQRNHHAHIMLTTREIGPEGFGAKERDWNAKDLLVDWRQSWAEHVNDTFERCDISERVDHRTLVAQRADALSLAHDAKERGDEPAQAEHMARAVELDRPALPSMSAGSWSMMRRGLTTPAAERWQDVKQLAAQAREIAVEFKDWARDWLDRMVDGMQERTVADGPSMRQREPQAPQSALERLQAAREGRGTADAPQTALERLQAARDGRTRDTGTDVVRNEERASHDLQQQDAERERVLEQERQRVLEQERTAERDGPEYGL
ncbi:MAG: MobQ family relaxase, partial [Nereida ignava]